MLGSFSSFLSLLLKMGFIAMIANEIRGLVLAAPVLYGIYQSGGTFAGIWIGISSLGGIALSVIVPVFAARKLKQHVGRRTELETAVA